MKLITILLFISIIPVNTVLAQKKEIRKRSLQEIENIVANPFELLGKTDSAILSAGHPFPIKEKGKWDVKIIEATEKNSMDASKSIVIGTDYGGLLLIVSAKSNLVYMITYIPQLKSGIEGLDIIAHLNDKYQFDKNGISIIKMENSSFIGVTVLKGGISIIAFNEDKKTLRFVN